MADDILSFSMACCQEPETSRKEIILLNRTVMTRYEAVKQEAEAQLY